MAAVELMLQYLETLKDDLSLESPWAAKDDGQGDALDEATDDALWALKAEEDNGGEEEEEA